MSVAVKDKKYWVHSFIGIALIFIIRNLPPFGPVTEFGMQILGVFVGLIYLWSLVGTFWPSLLGIILLGMTDGIGMEGIFAAFSNYTALLVLFCFIFCGALGDCGLTEYIGRWFLTRKCIEGHPTVFNFMIMLAMYIVAGLIDAIAAVLVMWPTMYGIMKTAGYTNQDKYPRVMTVCSFLAIAIGFGMIPFWGGIVVMLGTFEEASGAAVNHVMYLVLNVIMGVIVIALMALAVKYIFRADMEKMKKISIEEINKEKLPPMSIQQKIYVISAIGFLLFAILSAALPQDWGFVIWMNRLTLVGFAMLLIAVLVFVKIDGKPLMDSDKVTRDYVSWDMWFLVIVSLFFSGILLSDETGLKELLLDGLIPVLGNVNPIFFVALMIVVGVILTNYANNMVVGTILVQIIAAVAPELGLEAAPVAMITVLSTFVAFLSPAASPYAPALHTNSEWCTQGEIFKYGWVLIAICILTFLIIGYPIATILF